MRPGSEDGFTLIEMLVTVTISIVVFSATLAVIDVFQRDNVYAQQRNENQDNARAAMDNIARGLRNLIAPTATFAGALEQGAKDSLRFQTVDTSSFETGAGNESRRMRVRYCLNTSVPSNEVLFEQVQEWKEADPGAPTASACPDLTAGDWTRTRQLVGHVTNVAGGQTRALFTYSAKEAPQTLTVQTDLFLELNPGTRPGESELKSAVSLRNANRKPVAAFTVSPEAGKYEYRLNASESYDPDGQALTYKWWENGEPLETTAQIYTTPPLKTKTKYEFKLEVTNPGGLTAEAPPRTVTTP
jgi:prepilin-type N-terminal cleavage/methylation domain-containing protein